MADKTLNDVQNPEDEQWVKLGWTKDTADQEFNNKCLPSSVGIDQESLIDGNNEKDVSKQTFTSHIEDISIDENKESDEFDDISIIAESEIGMNDAKDSFVDPVVWKHKLHKCLEFYNVEKISQIGITKTLLIVCSLGGLMGLLAGYLLGEMISSKTDLDLRNMKATNNKLIDNLQDLSEVKSLVNEIKENLLPGMFKEPSKEFPEIPNYEDDDLKKLSHFLYYVFNVMDEMNPLTSDMRVEINKTHNTIEQLKALQKVMSQYVKELNELENSSQAKFSHHVHDKINQISRSSIDDFSDTLMKLNMRLHKRMNNFRSNLNKRLCKMKSTENPQLMDFLHQNHSFLENCETFDNTMNVDAFTNNKNYKKVNKQNIKKPPSSINCDTVKSNKYLSPEDSCFISQKSNPKNNHSNSSPKANNIPHKNNVPVNKQTSKETPSLNISKLEVPIQQGKNHNKNKNKSPKTESHQDRTNDESRKQKPEKRKTKLKSKENKNFYGNDFVGLKKPTKQNQKVLIKRKKSDSINPNVNEETKFTKNGLKNSWKYNFENEEQEEYGPWKRRNPSINSNWQFERSLAREEQRDTNSDDVVNWYLQRAYSRRRE